MSGDGTSADVFGDSADDAAEIEAKLLVRVKYVFGIQQTAPAIGIVRARAKIGLQNPN